MSEQLQPYEHPYHDLDDSWLNEEQLRARINKTMLPDQLRRAYKADRPGIIVDNVVLALNIAPRLENIMENGEIPTDKELDAQHVAKIANSLDNAQMFITEHLQHMNRREFGDMMIDILDDVQENHGNTDLYRALQHLRDTMPAVYRDALIQAHRLLVVALYIETTQPT